MELPQEGVFFVEGTAYTVKKAPKRFWPCQSCDLMDRCGDPEFFFKIPRCRKEARTDKTAIIYVEADRHYSGRE